MVVDYFYYIGFFNRFKVQYVRTRVIQIFFEWAMLYITYVIHYIGPNVTEK